jgi:hypothetical protein
MSRATRFSSLRGGEDLGKHIVLITRVIKRSWEGSGKTKLAQHGTLFFLVSLHALENVR